MSGWVKGCKRWDLSKLKVLETNGDTGTDVSTSDVVLTPLVVVGGALVSGRVLVVGISLASVSRLVMSSHLFCVLFFKL